MPSPNKRLVYLSEAVLEQRGNVPRGLGKIVIVARRYNREHGISGFLSYRRGFYFQVLEGSGSAVEALFDRIRVDTRHRNVVQLWTESSVGTRFFPSWGMRLNSAADTSSEIYDYLDYCKDRVEALDPSLRRNIDKTLSLNLSRGDGPSNAASGAHRSTELEFRLSALPSSFEFGLDHLKTIDMLAALLQHWRSIDELVELSELSAEEVRHVLKQPRVEARLSVRQSEVKTTLAGKNQSWPDAGRTKPKFYRRLQSFFGARKS